MFHCVVIMYVLFNVVIQGKPTRHPVFYMLISTHDMPLIKETMRKLQLLPGIEPHPQRRESVTVTTAPNTLRDNLRSLTDEIFCNN